MVSTNDSILEATRLKYLDDKISGIMQLLNFHEVRLSVLQDSLLLQECLMGNIDNDDNSINIDDLIITLKEDSKLGLRPEGTINLLAKIDMSDVDQKIEKFYYLGDMYRKVNGVTMESYRLGCEIYGDDTVMSDITIIITALSVLHELGLQSAYAEISSYGCPVCKAKYSRKLKQFLEDNKKSYCPECLAHFKKHTHSYKECEKQNCSETNQNIPVLADFLCDDCKQRITDVKHFLSNLTIRYQENKNIERTFNYYNGTVFDLYFQHNGEKVKVGGGGRYDLLTKIVKKNDIPSIGFDLNLKLISSLMSERNLFPMEERPFQVYICTDSTELLLNQMHIIQELHSANIPSIQGKVTLDSTLAYNNAVKSSCAVLVYISKESLYSGKVLINNISKEHIYNINLDTIAEEVSIIKKSLLLMDIQ